MKLVKMKKRKYECVYLQDVPTAVCKLPNQTNDVLCSSDNNANEKVNPDCGMFVGGSAVEALRPNSFSAYRTACPSTDTSWSSVRDLKQIKFEPDNSSQSESLQANRALTSDVISVPNYTYILSAQCSDTGSCGDSKVVGAATVTAVSKQDACDDDNETSADRGKPTSPPEKVPKLIIVKPKAEVKNKRKGHRPVKRRVAAAVGSARSCSDAELPDVPHKRKRGRPSKQAAANDERASVVSTDAKPEPASEESESVSRRNWSFT